MALKDLPGPTLTRPEREVAALVADGLTNREIAERLFISERTADGHLEHIREKLAVSTRAQVAAWFVAQAHTGGVALAPPQARDRRPAPVRLAIGLATLVTSQSRATSVTVRPPPMTAMTACKALGRCEQMGCWV